jgi:hypothetical protein
MMKEIRSETNEKRLLYHVAEISRYVRDSGGAGEALAFDYIEQQIQSWGISYQRYTHPAYISLPQKASLMLQTASGETISLPCITTAMSVSTSADGVTAPVFDTLHKQETTPLKGSIFIMDGLSTPVGTAWAAKEGACAVIFNNGSELHEMIVSTIWGSPSYTTKHQLSEIPVVSVEGKEAEIIREWLSNGACTATIITEVLTEWREIPLLVADVKADQAEKDFVLFSGHVDSWHYGAMDNASANAVQLETLRIFQERKPLLKRNLRVAFWSGHSHGRYAGSQWYADNHWQELYNDAVLHMYVDSVGGEGATVLTEAWAMPETKQVATESLKKQTEEEFAGSRFGRGGDQSFYGIGVSCLYMCMSEQPDDGVTANPLQQLFGGNGKTAGLGWWWHHKEDTIDKLNPAFLYRDASIYLLSLEAFLTTDILPLHYEQTIAELETDLQAWQVKAAGKLVLTDVAEALQDVKESLQIWEKQRRFLLPKDQNETLKRLSRHLVAFSYQPGSNYEHGYAGYHPPIPALALIDQLTETELHSDAYFELVVDLQRKKNGLLHHLLQAKELLDKSVLAPQI